MLLYAVLLVRVLLELVKRKKPDQVLLYAVLFVRLLFEFEYRRKPS